MWVGNHSLWKICSWTIMMKVRATRVRERETKKERRNFEMRWDLITNTSHVVFYFILFLSAMISNSTIISACAFDSGWKKRNDMKIDEDEFFIFIISSHSSSWFGIFVHKTSIWGKVWPLTIEYFILPELQGGWRIGFYYILHFW